MKIFRSKIKKGWKSSDATIPIDIYPVTIKLAECYYDIVQDKPGARTKDKQARVDGWLGQIAFQSVLIERKIPFIPHVPIYSPKDVEYGVPYDFYVEKIGKIEVKTRSRNPKHKDFACNVDGWKESPCDYVVGVKIHSNEEATIMGWFTRKQLEDLDIDDWGSGDAYWCPFNEMNPMGSFIDKLKLRHIHD